MKAIVRDVRELGHATAYVTGLLVWALFALFLVGQALQAAGVIE